MSDSIRLTYQVSLDGLREGTRQVTRKLEAETRRGWFSSILGNLLSALLGGLSLLFIVSQARDGRFELLTFFLGIIAGIIIYWRMLRRRADKIAFARYIGSEKEGPINAEFSEWGIRLETKLGRTGVSWRGVDEVWDLPKSICLVFGVFAHPIPRTTFVSAREAEDFFRQVTNWREAAQ